MYTYIPKPGQVRNITYAGSGADDNGLPIIPARIFIC